MAKCADEFNGKICQKNIFDQIVQSSEAKSGPRGQRATIVHFFFASECRMRGEKSGSERMLIELIESHKKAFN